MTNCSFCACASSIWAASPISSGSLVSAGGLKTVVAAEQRVGHAVAMINELGCSQALPCPHGTEASQAGAAHKLAGGSSAHGWAGVQAPCMQGRLVPRLGEPLSFTSPKCLYKYPRLYVQHLAPSRARRATEQPTTLKYNNTMNTLYISNMQYILYIYAIEGRNFHEKYSPWIHHLVTPRFWVVRTCKSNSSLDIRTIDYSEA